MTVTDPTTDLPPAPPPAAPAVAAPPAPPALIDAWPDAEPMPLTGWFERNGFSPVLTALLVFVSAFLLFQLVIAPIVLGIGVIFDMVRNGDGTPPDVGQIMEALTTNGQLMLTANTVGQALGFGLFAVLVARMHSPAVRAYLRIKTPDGAGLALAALGWATLYPAVIWTGQLNAQLPLPEWLRTLEQTQVDFLEGLLLGGDLSTPFLFVALALTPAICEELLFRGYLQRQVERKGGAVASIVLVGVLFGLYHLRLTQAVPLALLGVYLGFAVWATGSLWAGFLIHLLNNGLAVAATAYARADPDLDIAALEEMGVPWYFGVGGLALTVLVARVLAARRAAVVGDTPDAQPVPLSTPPLPSPPLAPLTP